MKRVHCDWCCAEVDVQVRDAIGPPETRRTQRSDSHSCVLAGPCLAEAFIFPALVL